MFMAKTKSFVMTEPEPPKEKEPELSPAEKAEVQIQDDDLQEILDTCDTLDLKGGHVKMFLRRRGETESAYVGKMSIEAFRNDGLDTLAAGPGGGDYTFKFCDSNGQFVKGRSLAIDPRFKGNLGVEKSVVVAPPDDDRLIKALEKMKPAAPADNGAANMMPLIITLITESNKTIAMLMSENQKSTNAILAGLINAIGEKKGTDPALLELIKQRTDKTPMAEALETVIALRELTDSVGGKDKEDTLEKFMKYAGPPLLGLLARGQPQMQMLQPAAPQAQPHSQANVQAAVAETPPPTSAAAATSAPTPEPKLTPFVPLLLTAARKGTPPDAYYDVICDNITDEQFDKLVEELETPTWFESLFGTAMEVVAQKPWFEKLRAVFLTDEVFEGDKESEKAKE